jgi:hypothetical protein
MPGKRIGSQAQRSRYFQGIAAAFFRLRGAPFVLSSKDVVTISAWEELGIPLAIVEEGMQRAYENFRKSRPSGRKLSALSFCDREVRRVFGEHRDRRVGLGQKSVRREVKTGKAQAEVRKFLEAGPAEAAFLREVYERALDTLSRKAVAEDELDRLEEQVEVLILERANALDRAELEKQVRTDFPGRSPQEREQASAVRLVKFLREKYRIPHLSLFYY